MTWVKIDDHFHEHPKVLAIPSNERMEAIGLFLYGLLYSSRMRSDGMIPKGLVDDEPLAERLCDVGLWHDAECAYAIHDYLEWNRSKSEIDALSEKRKAAGQRGGASKTQAKRKQTQAKGTPDTDTDTERTSTNAHREGFEKFWSAYPRKVDKGRARKDFDKAMKLTDLDTILAGVERYKKSDTVKDGYIKYPSTWLNAEGWSDEYGHEQKEVEW